jgi:protein arginine kinase
MELHELISHSGEWLSGAGPENEIVISSRVRLARNLAAFPFMSKASRAQRSEMHRICRRQLTDLASDRGIFYVDIDKADDTDRHLLVERHLISKQHVSGEGSRGVAVSTDEVLSVMVNEEDHLRLQVLRSGLQLRECWQEADRIDDQLQEHLEYAFSDRFGFLTACPTNVGTGLRISVMMHLPALKFTGEIEKVLRAAKDMHLAIRGLFGEGTDALGDFYQISNQTTLGRSEEEILEEFCTSIIPRIIKAELAARSVLEQERPLALADKIGRALGVLRNARLLNTEETLNYLSHLRLGVAMKRVAGLDLAAVNMLFLQTQPAHLQRVLGKSLEGEALKAARAQFIREKLPRGAT